MKRHAHILHPHLEKGLPHVNTSRTLRSRFAMALLLTGLAGSTLAATHPRFRFAPVAKDDTSNRICVVNEGKDIQLEAADSTSVILTATLILPPAVDPTQVKVTAPEGWGLAIEEYHVPTRALSIRVLPLHPVTVAAGSAVTCLHVDGVDARDLDPLGFGVASKADESPAPPRR